MGLQVGDKLGARLASLFLQYQMALRTQMAPVEARIRAAGTQEVIDRAGRETAGHYRKLLTMMHQADDTMPPWMLEFLQNTASGQNQWEALAGVAGLTGITGGLGTIMSNFLAPAVQSLVGAKPELQLDQNAAAAAVARSLIQYDYGAQLAAEAGFPGDQFQLLLDMAITRPDFGSLAQMLNRGILPVEDVTNILALSGYPAEQAGQLVQLAQALISPADAALAVLRGDLTTDQGNAIANANGYSADDFQVLIGNTGEPPALEEMLMLWRRGQISEDTLDRAITQSRVRDEWVPVVKLLAIEPPSAADVIDALVQGQVSQQEAMSRYAQAGGDPTWFATAFDTAANAPAPEQLAEMANRGVIPWNGTGPAVVSWEQGFYEGRWKDKWMGAFRQMAEYVPPPREVATLVKEGGLSQEQAMAYWQAAGLTPDLAALYWQAAHYDKTSALHELSQSEIIALYTDQAISSGTALQMLESINWPAEQAQYLLDLADAKRARKYLESAISKIHSLYIAWKIPNNTASAALAQLGVPAAQVTDLLAIWGLEQAANLKTLTPAEITDAYYYSIISPQEAQAMLQQAGYTAYDAWLLITIKAKGPIDGYPAPE